MTFLVEAFKYEHMNGEERLKTSMYAPVHCTRYSSLSPLFSPGLNGPLSTTGELFTALADLQVRNFDWVKHDKLTHSMPQSLCQ